MLLNFWNILNGFDITRDQSWGLYEKNLFFEHFSDISIKCIEFFMLQSFSHYPLAILALKIVIKVLNYNVIKGFIPWIWRHFKTRKQSFQKTSHFLKSAMTRSIGGWIYVRFSLYTKELWKPSICIIFAISAWFLMLQQTWLNLWPAFLLHSRICNLTSWQFLH